MTRKPKPDRHPRRQRRSRPRARTIKPRSLTRAKMAIEALTAAQHAELEAERPRSRADCRDAPRPCPWVGCKHHLFLDVNPETGSIKLNFPELAPQDLAASCALDAADAGCHTLDEVGGLMNLTRERVRQVEVKGLFALRAAVIREHD